MSLAGLAGLPAGLMQGQQFAQQQQLNMLRMQAEIARRRQQQEQEQAQALGFRTAAQQQPMAPQPTGGQVAGAQDLTTAATQPPQMPNVPSYGPSGGMAGAGTGGITGRGSVFGNAPGWIDKSDSGLQADGTPVAGHPGIALPDRSTLGKAFKVDFPNGRTMILPQRDIGPSRTAPNARDRVVDINAAGAEAAGYNQKNFPTDATFHVQLASSLGLSPEEHGQSQQLAQGIGSQIPPQFAGQVDIGGLARMIERTAGPGVPDHVKAMALGYLAPLMNQNSQAQFHDMMEVLKYQQTGAHEAAQERHQETQESLERRGQDIRVAEAGATRAQTRELAEERLAQGDKRLDQGQQKIEEKKGVPASDAEVKYWSEVLKQGGTLPPGLARTAGGSKMVQQIMANMAESGSPGDFIAKHSQVRADTTSLTNITKMADSATAFENTARLNFDKALQLAPDAIPSQLGPFFNRYIEEGETMFGDPNVPPYVAAILTAANEYAKIMSGATGSVGSTVDSRKEARELFSPYLSLPQLQNVIAVAKNDMNNRMQSNFAQKEAIQKDLGATQPLSQRGRPDQPTNQPPGYSAPGVPQPGTVEDGFRFKGGNASDPKNWEPVNAR